MILALMFRIPTVPVLGVSLTAKSCHMSNYNMTEETC
jgi:hypothetical protein